MALLVVIYRLATGEAVSGTDDLTKVANPLPAGLATKVFDPAPDRETQRWDPATLTFVPIPPPVRNALYQGVTNLIAKDPTVTPWTNVDIAQALRALLAITRNLVT